MRSNRKCLCTIIVDFVTIYNDAKRQLDELSSSSVDGPLAGDSIFRSMTRQFRNIMFSNSSTPGTNINGLSDMGISVNKTGQMEVNDKNIEEFGAVVTRLVRNVFIPIAAGGGIRNMQDVELLFNSGADKVVLNSCLHDNPSLVKEIVQRYGSGIMMKHIDSNILDWYFDIREQELKASSMIVHKRIIDSFLNWIKN